MCVSTKEIRCWIPGAPVHFWQNTSTSDSTYSFGKYLSALRHIEITEKRESAESHEMGEVVSSLCEWQ